MRGLGERANVLGIPDEFCITYGMTHWLDFTPENVAQVPAGILGVFQLAKSGTSIAYVGRADEDLRRSLESFLGKGYSHFQWVQLPWVKETYEMQCRLYHHAGGRKQLDNVEHPYPPVGKIARCPVTTQSPAVCDA